MSPFNVGKVCVFSKVEARLTLDGKPVSDVKVKRAWSWNGYESDTTVTDDNGYFSFPAVYVRSIQPLLPIEISISQQLSTEHAGEDYTLWRGVKRDRAEHSELDGEPFKISCDLSNEERLLDKYRSPILTLCKVVEN